MRYADEVEAGYMGAILAWAVITFHAVGQSEATRFRSYAGSEETDTSRVGRDPKVDVTIEEPYFLVHTETVPPICSRGFAVVADVSTRGWRAVSTQGWWGKAAYFRTM